MALELTALDFKAHFTRDFPYFNGSGCPKEFVTDADINKAFAQASVNFNPSLFSDINTLNLCYLYLTAHYLVTDFQIAAGGLNSVGYNQVSSRSVGSVSESYDIPEWIKTNPVLAAYTTTRYGQKYLSLIRPLLIGGVGISFGATTAT